MSEPSQQPSSTPRGRGRGSTSRLHNRINNSGGKPPKKPFNISTPSIKNQYKNLLKEFGTPEAIKNLKDDNNPIITRKTYKPTIPVVNRTKTQASGSLEDIQGSSTSLSQQSTSQYHDVEMHDNEDLESQTENTADTQGNLPNSSGTTQKLPKPSPIYIYNIEFNTLTTLLTLNDIDPESFYINTIVEETSDKSNNNINSNSNLTISLHADNISVYKNILLILKDRQIDHYSYSLKNEKPKSIVLKGITQDIDPDILKFKILDKKPKDVEIVKVIPMDSNNSRNKNYIIQVSPTSNISELKKINLLNFQRVHWEKLRKDQPFQCKNCQQFGHCSSNCNLKFRCVKCAQSHDYGKCPLPKECDRNLLHCANCDQSGHPANYKGCAFYKTAIKLHKSNKLLMEENKLKKIRQLAQFVTPNITFADKLKSDNKINSYTTLKINNHNVISALKNDHIIQSKLQNKRDSSMPINTINNEPPLWATNMHNTLQNHIDNSIAPIASQVGNLTSIVTNNTSRINLIMAHLGLDQINMDT
uniref:Pre-C2HC domain-containing protein n=1 Tax=Bracon brevicornis TaxID=1563983 RepID=A0A6V7JBE4_9HYME